MPKNLKMENVSILTRLAEDKQNYFSFSFPQMILLVSHQFSKDHLWFWKKYVDLWAKKIENISEK